MKKTASLVILMFFIFLSTLVMAQSKDKVSSLGEMVVTASRYKEPIADIPANIQVITQQEIEASTAYDLGELLSEKGIGTIRQYPGALTSVGIRGFRTDTHGNDLLGHVLILLDGRRAGTGNVAKILTKNIERIEIIRGPGAVQYGSAGIGGVINVITKKGKGKPHGFVEGTLGSYNFQQGTFGGDGKINNLDFSFAYTRGKMDDYDTGSDEKFKNTGYSKKSDYSFNIGYEFLPGNRIGVIYTKFEGNKIGSPGYLSQNDLDNYKDTSLSSVDFIYDGSVPSMPISWRLRYFQGADKDKWVDPTKSNPSGWDDGIPSFNYTKHRGAQGQVTIDLDKFVVTTGVDWLYYILSSDPYPPQKTDYTDLAGFILTKAKFIDNKLILTAGARYDKYRVDIKKGQGSDKDKSHTCPTIGASYLLTQNIKLRANYAQGYRMPSAKELASDYYSWWTHYKGNPNLDPERSWTAEGGVDVAYSLFQGSIGYFYTNFKDKIVTKSDFITGIVTYENHGKAKIDGIEGNLSFNFGKILDINYVIKPYGNIVYILDREDKETDKDLKYIERLTASYGIYFSDMKGLWSDLNFEYHGNQWIDDWEAGWPAPVIKKGGFTVANFSIGKKLMDFGKSSSLSIKGEIRNLLNKDYSFVKGYPMPGRSFYIGMRLDF